MRGLELGISELSQMIAQAVGICSFSGSCVDCGEGCRVREAVQFFAKVKYHIKKGGKKPTIKQCAFCRRQSYCEGRKFEYDELYETCRNFRLYEPLRYFYELFREGGYILPGTGKL